jgi:L,D-transpeptidase catalytic domain
MLMRLMKFKMWQIAMAGIWTCFCAAPSIAQDTVVPPAAPPIVFKSGTGDGVPLVAPYTKPPRAELGCDALAVAQQKVEAQYYPAEFAVGLASPRRRLEQGLFEKALTGYRNYYCRYGRTVGPAVIVIVDFAQHSSQPRLYRVDLRSGDGLDNPIHVAHGIGSDPDDDGFATRFGNVQDSLMSSLGPAIGGEIYSGINGISLRLDGLEPSNNAMRARDIVVHSYQPDRRRYFNASLITARSGKPGASEGCFVVEPSKREWILDTLANGGYIYSGYSGALPMQGPTAQPSIPVQNVNFVPGTGTP